MATNNEITYLQEVSDHRYLSRLLIRFGIESAVWGPVLALIAIPTLLKGGSAAALILLLMLALVGHGLFVIAKPYPKGILVGSILRCCVGCVLLAAASSASYFVFIRAWLVPWWVLGLSEVAGGLVWATYYKRLSHVSGSVPSEWLSYLESLVRAVKAAPRNGPSTVEVVKRGPLGSERLKGQLYSEMAIFVGPHRREVVIADRSDFLLGLARKGPVKKWVSSEMGFVNKTIKISTTRESYQKLSEWTDLGMASPAMQLSQATV
jgi:hypothetical protein